MHHRDRTKKTAILEQSPLFRDLSRRDLRLVEQHADQVAVPAGTIVAYPGRLAREFVVVHEGILWVQPNEGPITRLYPGDFYGELALRTRSLTNATVITETAASLIVVEARSFAFLIETVPALRRRVVERCLRTQLFPALRE